MGLKGVTLKWQNVVSLPCGALELFRKNFKGVDLPSIDRLKSVEYFLKTVPWHLAEFYYNAGLLTPYSGTCTILQETINRFLCSLFLNPIQARGSLGTPKVFVHNSQSF